MTRYPDALEQQLRGRLAALHSVAPDRIVLGCGSTEILGMAASAFLDRGSKIVLAQPTFEGMSRSARHSGAEIVAVPLRGDYTHDLETMVLQAGARLFYLCNPNNPTGTLTKRQELESFLRRVPAGAHVVLDEAYHHYVGASPEYASFIDHPVPDDRLIVVRTFSAVYGLAGLRVGYAVAAPSTARLLEASRQTAGVSGVGVLAALAALEDVDHVRMSTRRNADERQEFCNQANARMLRTIDSQANFVMLNTGHPAAEMIEHFRKNGVLVAGPIERFDKYIRVSIGTASDMREFWRVWDLLPPNHVMVM